MLESETQEVTTVRVSKAAKPPPPPGPSPLSVEQDRMSQLVPDPPLRRPVKSFEAGSSNHSSPIAPPFAANLSPITSPSSPRKFQRPVDLTTPIQGVDSSDTDATNEKGGSFGVDEDVKNSSAVPLSSSSSSSSTSPGIGRRPSILPHKSSSKQRAPFKFLLSGTSKLGHSDKGIIPIAELDTHFESLLLPGEWLKIDYKNLRLPPPMMTNKATDFIDDLNAQHRYPIRPYNNQKRNGSTMHYRL